MIWHFSGNQIWYRTVLGMLGIVIILGHFFGKSNSSDDLRELDGYHGNKNGIRYDSCVG
jgi:hypothetical protein